MSTDAPAVLPSSPLGEPETLQQLLGDCHRMALHWKTPAPHEQAVVLPAGLHGITVPAASAHVVSAMAEYGD
jgi:hypothetical protein